MQGGGGPQGILAQGTQEDRGEDARLVRGLCCAHPLICVLFSGVGGAARGEGSRASMGACAPISGRVRSPLPPSLKGTAHSHLHACTIPDVRAPSSAPLTNPTPRAPRPAGRPSVCRGPSLMRPRTPKHAGCLRGCRCNRGAREDDAGAEGHGAFFGGDSCMRAPARLGASGYAWSAYRSAGHVQGQCVDASMHASKGWHAYTHARTHERAHGQDSCLAHPHARWPPALHGPPMPGPGRP